MIIFTADILLAIALFFFNFNFIESNKWNINFYNSIPFEYSFWKEPLSRDIIIWKDNQNIEYKFYFSDITNTDCDNLKLNYPQYICDSTNNIVSVNRVNIKKTDFFRLFVNNVK